MSLLSLAVATFWCSLARGLSVETSCAQNDHACKADIQTGGVGMMQKKHSLESATLEDSAEDLNAEETEMDAALLREMQQAMARDRARVKMRVEQDLSKLSDEHYRAWDPSTTCHDNADQAFDHFLDTSDLTAEMNVTEVSCFRQFFDEHVEAACKKPSFTGADWTDLIKEAFEQESPVLTQALADAINQAHNISFSVTVPKCMPKRELNEHEGLLDDDATMQAAMLQQGSRHREIRSQTPASFDPVVTWPECSAVILKVHNQGTCGSCWAFAGAQVMDARVCIASGGLFQNQFSRTVLASCSSTGDGCNGGMPGWVFDYMASSNTPSGGASGCVPYFAHGEGTDHFHESQSEPACPTECLPHSGLDFAADSLTTPGSAGGGFAWMTSTTNGYTATTAKLTTFKNLIMQGPVSIAVYVGNAFYGYSSGVFDSDCGTQANHAVTAIGWGALGGQAYFDTINSWGSHWGDNGGMKMASCTVNWYQYPGDFTGAASGWNFVPTPPPSAPPPTPSPAFTIDGSGCTETADGCVASQNYPSDYPNDVSCRIQNMPRPFIVEEFNTEFGFDKLFVGSTFYTGSGTGQIDNTLTGDIQWSSDFTVVSSGWKICPPSSGPSPASPVPLPTPLPSPSPTPLPSPSPTPFPTPLPTPLPSPSPTPLPSPSPTPFPTNSPTPFPTAADTGIPGTSNIFDMIDANGDNVISKTEFENAPFVADQGEPI